MYVLVQICLNAASGDNLPKQIFNKSVLGALKRSPAFRTALNEGAEWLESGARRYPVDTKRFDAFFDSLCCALFFERYNKRYDPNLHGMKHIYLSFRSEDAEYQRPVDSARDRMATFFDTFSHQVEHYEAAKIDEVVYGNQIVDPAGANASITIMHSFYACFEVMSLLTTKHPLFVLGQVRH